jgi:hypothetical protein
MAGHVAPRPFPIPAVSAIPVRAQTFLWAAARRLLLPVLCLIGFSLRLHLLAAYPLREDEAMYSVWALHLWRVDPLALTVWPDKPPLFLWLLGSVFQLFGPSEAAARLLNIAADSLTIGVVAAIARTLWGNRAAIFAAAAYSLNPFAISFAPTVYTDPTLVLWGMLALYAARTRRPFWAGLALAAAIVTKQQGLLYAPLILAVTLFGWEDTKGKRQKEKAKVSAVYSQFTIHNSLFTIRYFLFGFAILLLPVLLWDAARWDVAPSPWDLSVRNYAPLRLLGPAEWLPRTIQWGAVAWHLVGSWWVVGYWGWGLGTGKRIPALRLIPVLWLLGFVVLHIVTSVQIWDRYLLPLAPLIALAMGWVGAQLSGVDRRGWLAALILPALLLPPALTAARGGLPVGGDHGDYAGLTESVDWLRAHAPADAVIYHRDVSWQLRFAFFAATPEQPQASAFELRWFPNAVYLADNAAKTPERRKFLVEPVWAAVGSAAPRLQQRAIGWQPRLRAANFTVYELTSPPPTPCTWCLCTDRTAHASPAWIVAFRPLYPVTLSSCHLVTPSGLRP